MIVKPREHNRRLTIFPVPKRERATNDAPLLRLDEREDKTRERVWNVMKKGCSGSYLIEVRRLQV